MEHNWQGPGPSENHLSLSSRPTYPWSCPSRGYGLGPSLALFSLQSVERERSQHRRAIHRAGVDVGPPLQIPSPILHITRARNVWWETSICRTSIPGVKMALGRRPRATLYGSKSRSRWSGRIERILRMTASHPCPPRMSLGRRDLIQFLWVEQQGHLECDKETVPRDPSYYPACYPSRIRSFETSLFKLEQNLNSPDEAIHILR